MHSYKMTASKQIHHGDVMPVLTVRNLPETVHRALRLRAAQNGRSTEAEVRALLEEAVKPQGRLKLGSWLAGIGQKLRLTDEEAALINKRDKSPPRSANFE